MRSYLIVDDNVALAENLAEIIRDRGDDAVVVGSGREALAQVEQRRFDAVLTDMRMPEMDGATLVREVRRSDPGVPAIVITAFFKDVGIRAALHEGPLAVLPKPVPVPLLLHLLSVAKRNGRVLLVEDDAVLADNLIEVLQERGFSVVRLKAVAEIEGLPADRPLLAVVDMRVPGGPDGEAARLLAQRFAGMPILVATASGDIPIGVVAQRFFHKPFDTGELVAAIESVHQDAGATRRD